MKKYSNDKNINRLVQQLVSSHWQYRRGKKHGAIVAPSGEKVSIPSTPSCSRAFYNFRADIRQLHLRKINHG